MSQSAPGPPAVSDGKRNSRPRRTSTTRTFFDPSPSAATSGRPKQAATSSSISNSHYHSRVRSNHSSQEPHGGSLQEITESESEEEGRDQSREVSKLELRRAKNRLKQRNLRHRRATHVTQLEDSVRALKHDLISMREHNTLQTTVVTSNELKYRSWLADLEGTLLRQGLGGEVERSRQAWERSIQAIPTLRPLSARPAKPSRKPKVSVKQEPRDDDIEIIERYETNRGTSINPSASGGSISTLVQAALVSDSTHMSAPTSSGSHLQSSIARPDNMYQGYGHQQTPILGSSRPPSQSGSRYADKIGVGVSQHRTHPKPLTVYPGSLQALSNPPSLPRHPYRSRTTPNSGNYPRSHPSGPASFNNNMYPEDPEDRKRKRSLSGPTLYSSRLPNELPPITSLSAPNSGLISQPPRFSHQVPSLPLAPMASSSYVPRSRPSSSHYSQGQTQAQLPLPPANAGRSGWNTLAPFRPQTAPSSRPTTPSGVPAGPFAYGLEASPQHMKIENLISSKPDDRS